MDRLCRWVGCPSAMDDPFVRRKLASGGFSLATVGALRRYEYHQRTGLSPGAERILGPGHAGGFSRTYRFTPAAPFQWMADADAALLFANRWDRWEFVDVTDAPVKDRAPMRPQDWQALLADFAVLAAGRGDPMSERGALGRQLARPYR